MRRVIVALYSTSTGSPRRETPMACGGQENSRRTAFLRSLLTIPNGIRSSIRSAGPTGNANMFSQKITKFTLRQSRNQKPEISQQGHKGHEDKQSRLSFDNDLS